MDNRGKWLRGIDGWIGLITPQVESFDAYFILEGRGGEGRRMDISTPELVSSSANQLVNVDFLKAFMS